MGKGITKPRALVEENEEVRIDAITLSEFQKLLTMYCKTKFGCLYSVGTWSVTKREIRACNNVPDINILVPIFGEP